MKKRRKRLAAEFYMGHRMKRRWRRIVTCLAAVVAFCTAYALILPAVTLENRYLCGLEEHTHSAECYAPAAESRVLACTLESLGIHRHTEACYDGAGNLVCGYADFVVHTHDAACYDESGALICPLPEIKAHTHDASCYAIPEHTHTKECYIRERGELTCGLEESEGHTHSAEAGCYDEDGGLICPLAESAGHQHTDDCYEWSDVLTCGLEVGPIEGAEPVLICEKPEIELHEHTEDCYATDGDGNQYLICGKVQVLEHRHTDACFSVVDAPVLICPLEEHTHDASCMAAAPEEAEPVESVGETAPPAAGSFTGAYRAEAYLLPPEAGFLPVNAQIPMLAAVNDEEPTTDPDSGTELNDYITKVEIKRRAPGETLWVDIVGDNVRVDDELLFDIHYELPGGTLKDDNCVVIYQVPDSIKVTKDDSGPVVNGEDKVGTYTIGTDGRIKITFNQEYARENGVNNTEIIGHIAFESTVVDIGGSEGEDVTIPFQDGCTLHVKNTSGDLTVTKTSKNVVASDGTLDYKITVSSEHGTGDKVILKDIMTNVAMIEGTLTVKCNDTPLTEGENGYIFTKDEDGTVHLVLPKMEAEDKYIIAYSAETTSTPPTTSATIATNAVTASSTDSAGIPVKDDDTVTDVFTRKLIEKSGVLNEDGTVSWTIRLNTGEAKIGDTETQRADISGWKLEDEMGGQEYTGEVTITPNPNTGSDFLTTNLPYTFPKNSPKVEYIVTYTTDGTKETSNTATLSPPGGGTGAGTTVQPGEVSISKAAEGYELLDRDANGDLLLRMDWNLTVDASGCAIPADREGTLLGRSTTKGDWPNNGYWYFYDYAQQGSISHYYTPEQLTAAAQNIAAAIDDSGYEGGYYIFGCEDTWSTTDNLVLIQKGDKADNFWDNTYLNGVAPGKSLNDGKNRNYLYVLFDKELERGTMFNFDYSTTANLGQGVNSTQVSNHAEIHTKSLSPGATEYQTYYATVAKYDGRKGSNSIGTKTEYLLGDALDYASGSATYENVLEWHIRILFPEGETYSEPVVITEALPEGLEVLKLSETGGRSKYALYVNFGTSTSNINDIFKGYNCFFGEGADVSYTVSTVPEVTNGTVKPGVNECNNTCGEYTIHFTRNEANNTYTITVPVNLANKLAETGGAGMIYVWAQIEDPTGWTGIEQSFVNTATVETGGKKIGEASQEQIVKRTVIKKSSEGYDAENDPNEIPYVLTINQEGADLVVNSETLTLTDVLSFTPPETANINAWLTDVVVTDSNTGDILTAQCPYTASGETKDGKVTRTFTMTIPDSTPLTVTYTYKMSGTGQVEDFKNTATVEGTGTQSSSDENTMEITVQSVGAEAYLSGVNVDKVDGKNYGIRLDGAEFKLEEWNDSTWLVTKNLVTATTETEPAEKSPSEEDGEESGEEPGAGTGKSGTFNTGALRTNTAYRLTETKAPDGYTLDKTPYYFYVPEKGGEECMPVDFKNGYEEAGKTYPVYALNMGDHIMIANNAPEYELPETGGAGTVPYILGGLILMLSLLLLYRVKRRKEDFASS